MVRTWKDALHEVVFESKVPAKQLASLTGIGYNYLANCANDHQDDELRGKLLIPLTISSRNDSLIKFICDAVGGVFLRLPDIERGGMVAFNENIIETIEHLGELSRSYREAMADGVLSPAEQKELEKIKHEIIRHVMGLLTGLSD